MSIPKQHRMRFIPRWLAVSVVLAVALLVAGCSTSDDNDESGTMSTPRVSSPAASNATNVPATATATQAAATGPRTLTDAAGKQVTINGTPQRVLALSEPDLDAALALGVKPVGTLNGRGQSTAPRYLGERISGIPVIGEIYQPDLEKAIALRPDLILAGGYPDQAVVERLRQVAPTFVTFNLGEDWKTVLKRAGTALNREAEATAFMTQYERMVQDTKSKLGANAHATVSVSRWNPQGPGYMLNDSFAAQVLGDLGLKRPANQDQPGQGHSPPLSLEALNQLDADWLFLGTLSPEGDAVKALESAMNTPNFKSLKAVQTNHLVMVDGSLWTSLGGPLAAMAVINDVTKAMAAR